MAYSTKVNWELVRNYESYYVFLRPIETSYGLYYYDKKSFDACHRGSMTTCRFRTANLATLNHCYRYYRKQIKKFSVEKPVARARVKAKSRKTNTLTRAQRLSRQFVGPEGPSAPRKYVAPRGCKAIRKKKSYYNEDDFIARMMDRIHERVIAKACDREGFLAQQSKEAARRIVRNVCAQSGETYHKTSRECREEHQRACAKAKVKAAWKRIPKEVREKSILQERDKRNSRYEVEPQSGATKALVAGAASIITFQVANILNGVRKVLKKADRAIEGVEGMLQGMWRCIEKTLSGCLGKIFFVISTWFLLTRIGKARVLILPVIAGLMATKIGKKIWNLISKFFPEGDAENDIEPQSFGMAAPLSLIGMMLIANNPKIRDKTGALSRILQLVPKHLHNVPRLTSGLEMVLGWTIDVIDSIVHAIGRLFGKEWNGIRRNEHRALNLWLGKSDKIVSDHSTAAVDATPAELNRIINTLKESAGFIEVYRNSPFERKIRDAQRRLYDTLQPHLGAINARNNFRFEPVCCILRGAPGVGKTVLTLFISAAVMKLSGMLPADADFDTVTEQIFQKGTSEYWNGYSCPLTLILDDVFQQRADPSDKDNEYINLIRMISSWSFPLNFADLTSKGRIFFGSKFVLGTTNIRSIRSEASKVIAEPEAVARRINYGYDLVLKEEYMEDPISRRTLSKIKLEQEILKVQGNTGLDSFPWYMWNVRKHNFMSGQTDSEVRPLRDLVVEISDTIKHRLLSYEDDRENLKKFVQTIVPQSERVDVCLIPNPARMLAEGYVYVPSDEAPEDEEDVEIVYYQEEASNTNSPQTVGKKTFGDRSMNTFRKMGEWFKDPDGAYKGVVIALGLAGATLIPALSSAIISSAKLVASILASIIKKILSLLGIKKEKKVEEQSNRPPTKPQKIKTQGPVLEDEDTDHNREVLKKVYGNSYKMVIEGPTTMTNYGQVTFVESNMFMSPQHFTDEITSRLKEGIYDDKHVIKFVALKDGASFEVPIQTYLSFERYSFKDADLEFVKFKPIVLPKKITQLFISESQVRLVGGNSLTLGLLEADIVGNYVGVRQERLVTPSSKLLKELKYARILSRHFEYNAPTVRGHCGALACLTDSRRYKGACIVGMHVCGDSNRQIGCSTIVTREMVQRAKDALNIVTDNFLEDAATRGITIQSGFDLPFDGPSSFQPIGTTTEKVNLPGKTALYKVRQFYVPGEYTDQPAHLKAFPTGEIDDNGNPIFINPMRNALAPYASGIKLIDMRGASNVMHVAMRELTRATRDCTRDIFTFEQSVLGIPELKFRSIPRGTSAGYPYILSQHEGKKAFFGDNEEYDLTSEQARELRQRVEYIIECARNNERCAHIFVDFLKDELRSEAKVAAGKTRLISSAPLDYTVAWRQYFGAFSAAMMNSHIVTGMAPGICTYSEWGALYSHLQQRGKLVFDGDFQGFDSSEQPDILNLILDFVNSWYSDGEENSRIRTVLWMDLTHSRHIGGPGYDQKYIYQWMKSLPSGHPFTTVVNSMYSLFLLVAAYEDIVGKVSSYWDYVSPITYGDDNVSNVADIVAPVYNQRSVAAALRRRFGVVYTPGTKDDVWVETTTIDKVGFLKRGFSVHTDAASASVLCPLELTSFLYTSFWCRNAKEEKRIMLECAENGLEELALHSDETWKQHHHRFMRVFDHYGYVSRNELTRRAYLRAVLARVDYY